MKKYQVLKIFLNRVEGIEQKAEVKSFEEANKILMEWAITAPKDGAYDKVDFLIVFEDLETYKGRFDLQYKHITECNLLDNHVKTTLKFYAGLYKPAHITEKEYNDILKTYGENLRQEAKRMLEYYEIP